MFAEEIDNPWDALRVLLNGIQCFFGKNRCAVSTRDSQALGHVAMRFLLGQWNGSASENDSLQQLPQLRPIQFVVKLWLAG